MLGNGFWIVLHGARNNKKNKRERERERTRAPPSSTAQISIIKKVFLS
jgi:hypothetical protein